MHLFKRCMMLLFVIFLLPLSVTYAAPEILPVDQIKPGMQGIAKTVVAGTQIEEFGVEVLGVMANQGPSGDLILVRTYGAIIDRTGGIVQGMSGSPVYIDGKLVGAIAYGWPLTDHTIGMVTPIADMLKLWDVPDFKNQPAGSLINPAAEETNLEPVATPLMAAGYSEQALKMLADKLKPFNMVPYSAGAAPGGAQFGPLEPGSAVGVELVRGDISLSALGTVTYTEGGKVLAFGHPFLKKGNSGYFMTNAYIYTTVSGLESGFKVGTTGEALGVINQDRSTGVAGEIGRFPSIIPVRMNITDVKQSRTQEYAVQVVNDEQLAPALAATAVFNVIDKTIDRTGAGTAKVSFEIMARDMPGEVLKRDNMFYSSANISELAVAELFDAMNLLANNKFNPVDIIDVKTNVEIYDERRTASIVEARANTASAKPGDQVEITVELKPYRGETITRVIPFVIPKDRPEGSLLLEVRGGGMVPVTQLLLKQQGIDLNKANDNSKSFADIVNDFAGSDRNNDIVVEILAMNDAGLAGQGEIGAQAKEKKPKVDARSSKLYSSRLLTGNAESIDDAAKGKSHITTDYIIDNDAKVTVNVIRPK